MALVAAFPQIGCSGSEVHLTISFPIPVEIVVCSVLAAHRAMSSEALTVGTKLLPGVDVSPPSREGVSGAKGLTASWCLFKQI